MNARRSTGAHRAPIAAAIAPVAALVFLLASCDGSPGRRVVEEDRAAVEAPGESDQQPGTASESGQAAEAVAATVLRSIDREVSGGLRPLGTVETGALATAAPVRWGDVIVVGTASGDLIATDVNESRELWRARLDASVDALAATSTSLFASAGATLVRLSPVTGEIEWSVGLDGDRAATSLTVTRSALYLGLVDGSVVAHAPQDGAERWLSRPGGTPVGRMILVDGRLHVATEEGELAALDGADGSIVWRVALGGAVAAGPADLAGRIAAATIDGSVSVLALDGETLASWRVDAAPVLAPLVGSAGRLVVFDGAGSVHAFDADGAPVWRLALAGHLAGDPGRIGDVAIAGEASGGLVAIELSDGDVVSRIALGSAPTGEAVVVDNELVWALADGTARRIDVDGEIEQAPLFSSEGSWVLPEHGTFRLEDERVALSMRSDRDAVFEISVSAAPAEDLVLRVVSDAGATVATNMGKVELERSVRAALDAGASYELVIERPDAAGEVVLSVETRQLE